MRAVSFFSILALTGAIAFTSPAPAQGDAANGERVFNKCKACHTVEEDKNKVGPTLYNVIGRRAGSLEDFRYSSAMKEYGAAGTVWDEEELNANLETPTEVVQGTQMSFVGLKKQKAIGRASGRERGWQYGE